MLRICDQRSNAVDAESECSNCNVARILKTVTPFARRCRMRSFECPNVAAFLGSWLLAVVLQKPRRRLTGRPLGKRRGDLSRCLDAGIDRRGLLARRAPEDEPKSCCQMKPRKVGNDHSTTRLCCPMAALSSSSKALALASPSFRRPTST